VFVHGYGRYDAIRDDPTLCFARKIEEVKKAKAAEEKAEGGGMDVDSCGTIGGGSGNLSGEERGVVKMQIDNSGEGDGEGKMAICNAEEGEREGESQGNRDREGEGVQPVVVEMTIGDVVEGGDRSDKSSVAGSGTTFQNSNPDQNGNLEREFQKNDNEKGEKYDREKEEGEAEEKEEKEEKEEEKEDDQNEDEDDNEEDGDREEKLSLRLVLKRAPSSSSPAPSGENKYTACTMPDPRTLNRCVCVRVLCVRVWALLSV
jgi:hypothetical protein